MEGSSKSRTLTDIGETAKRHADIGCQLLAAHALTGCDTVACMWGIGKARALKVFSSDCQLLKIGNPTMLYRRCCTEGNTVRGNVLWVR